MGQVKHVRPWKEELQFNGCKCKQLMDEKIFFFGKNWVEVYVCICMYVCVCMYVCKFLSQKVNLTWEICMVIGFMMSN